jgi:conjugative transfer region protein (TIGR03748 family)
MQAISNDLIGRDNMKIDRYKSLRKHVYLGAVISLISVFSLTASAKSDKLIQTGQYLTVNNQIPAEQFDLLSPIIQVHFLSDIKTVGDAITDVLRYSGYALVETRQQTRDLQNTLKKPLPIMQRDLGPLSLRQVLTLLIGPAFHLIVDPLNRVVDFQTKSQFTAINQ